jgi:hypothetical protein
MNKDLQKKYISDEQIQKFEKKVDELKIKCKDAIKYLVEDALIDDSLDFKELTKFAMKMIPVVQKLKGIKGEDKKEIIIILIVITIINDTKMSDNTKETIISKIKDFLPEIIDGIILVSQQINKGFGIIKKSLTSCCKN